MHEEERLHAYYDGFGNLVADSTPLKDRKGKITLGIGFNMDRPEAREEWCNAFSKNGPDFELVRNGKITLIEAQSNSLFDYTIKVRDRELSNHYDCWNKLRANEQLAIYECGAAREN